MDERFKYDCHCELRYVGRLGHCIFHLFILQFDFLATRQYDLKIKVNEKIK